MLRRASAALARTRSFAATGVCGDGGPAPLNTVVSYPTARVARGDVAEAWHLLFYEEPAGKALDCIERARAVLVQAVGYSAAARR